MAFLCDSYQHMNLDTYAILSVAHHRTYEFLSQGPQGSIKKVVIFQEIQPGVFNLAFGDWDEVQQKINDDTRSNNADRDKILATVASTVMDFINYFPKAIIQAQGGTPAKTRLYQGGLNKHLKDIREIFDIYGSYQGIWEPFVPGKNYNAFVIRAK